MGDADGGGEGAIERRWDGGGGSRRWEGLKRPEFSNGIDLKGECGPYMRLKLPRSTSPAGRQYCDLVGGLTNVDVR